MNKLINILLLLTILGYGCDRINRDPYADTPTSGRISICVDETFKPVVEAELMVFHALYRYAEIKPRYQAENDCFRMLMEDSVRLIIASRTLSQEEKNVLWAKKIIPREIKIATDGITLVVNLQNTNTVISMGSIERILTGEITDWKQINPVSTAGSIIVVFDNKRSSIVRHAIDSIARGKSLSGNLYALDSNVDVVDYVSKNVNALGLIGVSWISDSDDSTQLSFLDKIKVMAISKDEPANADNTYKPYQAYIFDGSYPLTRDVYAIDTEPRNGLATGFTSFLASDKGQRIILKSGIVPANAPIRLVNVREDL